MLTVNKVCEMYYVTPRTVYRWIEDGAPFTKIGFKWFCEDKEALRQWNIDKNKKEGN